MEEFRAFVEEGGVVFVAFENEMFAFTEMKAGAEIFGDAADQKRRVESGGVENPRQHRRGCGLAVSSGHDQHFFADEEFVVQQLRQRTEGDALVEEVLEFDVAARHGVADDDQIGARVKILRVERLCHGDAQLAEEIRHGRIGGGVGAGDVESALLQHAGQRGHGGAADADQVNVFFFVHLVKQDQLTTEDT